MGTVKRRRRTPVTKSLTRAFEAGELPPADAAGFFEELEELVFFGAEVLPFYSHPSWRAWWRVYVEAADALK